jgi:asparagine synthase (glutamine-hydrolysing)
MSGLAGIIGVSPSLHRQAALEDMLKCMLHRPHSDFATYLNRRINLWSGCVSSREDSSLCPPQWNERRDICLIFSGEDFTDPREIQNLRALGHEFGPDSAGHLVHWYEECGLKFLEKLNGGFSGLLVDLRKETIILFNDRYGLNRIYYHEDKDGLYFSSEAKSLLRILPHLRQFDLKGLGEFVSCGCVLQNRTLFSGISLLPPGSAWTFSPGRPMTKESYFKKEQWEQQPQLSAGEFYQRLKEVWERILPRYFRGVEKVGLSLTGGVDSRMIMAWAPRSAGDLPCYTFGGSYRDCADVRISREIARICRQPHEVISLGSEFLSEFPALAERAVYLSDGALDVTGAVDVYVQRKAREIAPVRVTGTNGGEILRRLVAFKPTRLAQDFLQPELALCVAEAFRTYAAELKGHQLSFTAFKQAPWYMGSKFMVERSELTLRMPYFDNELVALAYQAPVEVEQSNDMSLRLIADGSPALGLIATDRGLVDHAIPGLRPVRHLFEEFLFKAEYAYDYGMPQWLARIDQVFAQLRLERLFLGRHKFAHFRVWYRRELSPYVKDVLLNCDARSRPYLCGNRVAEIVNSHVSGSRNYTREIHKLLTIELIQRQLIERN